MDNLDIKEVDVGVVFTVKVLPASATTQICGFYNGMLKVKVAAAPEKGKANSLLLRFLAGRLRVKKKDMAIISGHTGPLKHVRVSGISAEMLLQRLGEGGGLT